MVGERDSFEKRQEQRYEIAWPEPIAVHVFRQQPAETIHGQLLDLSPRGAKISLGENLRFAESIGFRFVIPDPTADVNVDAEVCWVRPSGDSQWHVGCSFASPIPQQIFDRLASGGIINRRRHPRCPVSIRAAARWELDTETSPVEIRDYSDGGFCMASARRGRAEGNVMVEFETGSDTPVRILAEVRWQIERDGEYLSGCRFKSGMAAELLRDLSQTSRTSKG